MKQGDLVQVIEPTGDGEIGLFLGFGMYGSVKYADVMWLSWTTTDGCNITMIVPRLLKVINESR